MLPVTDAGRRRHPSPAGAGKTGQRIALGLFILGLAVFFRLWMFDQVPPGLQHDEVINAEDAVQLATQGAFRLYYPDNFGREGAFIWVLAASFELFHSNLMMIRFPSMVFGLLTVALLFRFGCQNYSLLAGTVAGGLAAVSFWAVFISRVGLRAVMMPVIVLVVLFCMAQLLNSRTRAMRRRAQISTGIGLGLAIYTYSSGFALCLAYAAFVAFAAVFQRTQLRRHLPGLLLAGVIALVIAIPMVVGRLTHPLGLQRAVDTIMPLYAAVDGDPAPLLGNTLKLAGFPAIIGDPAWRYNVAGRPVFLLPVGLLVYLGFALTLCRARSSPLNAFLICLAVFGLVPSLITLQAPSFIRLVVVLPCIMLFAGLPLARLGRFTARGSSLAWILAAVVVATTGIADYRAWFTEWATSEQRSLPYHVENEQGYTVPRIYRGDLQQLANWLEDSEAAVVAVSTPDKDLDPLLYEYAGGAAKVDTHVVFFNAQFNIVLSRRPMLLLVSPYSPIWKKHAHWLGAEYGTRQLEAIYRQDGEVAFDVYQLGSQPEALQAALQTALAEAGALPVYAAGRDGLQELRFPVQFGDLLRLQGVELPERRVYGENYGVHNQLYVEPLRAAENSIQFFMHLLDEDGVRVAQRDYLGASPVHWHSGVLFMQDNFVPFWEPLAAGTHHLYLGVYDWRSGERFPVLDGEGRAIADTLYLGEIEVIDRPG